MRARRIAALLFFALMITALLPGHGLTVPGPVLEADKTSDWESAWNLAWEYAWESSQDEFFAEGEDAMSPDAAAQETASLPQTSTPQASPVEELGVPSLSATDSFDITWGFPFSEIRPLSEDSPAGAQVASADSSALKAPGEGGADIGRLYVEVQPADARVDIMGEDFPYEQGMELPEGEYVVSIQRDGYIPQVRRVEVLAGMAANMEINLEMLIALAPAGTPTSDEPVDVLLPVAEGDLLLDPNHITIEHVNKAMLAPAASQQQAPQETQARTEPVVTQEKLSDEPVEAALADALEIAPAPTPGKLFVETVPSGAKVRVLNIKPVFEQGMELAAGEYIIDAAAPGFETQVQRVTLEEGRDASLRVVLEKAKPRGKLFVETVPAGAKVRVVNIRPKFHQGMELTEGEYVIDAALDGYNTKVATVSLKPDEDNTLTIELEESRPAGKLYVETVPPGAKVRVLNIKPVFQQGMELEAGEYTIDAAIDGYETTVKTFTLQEGHDQVLTVELEKKRPAGKLFVKTEPADAKVRVLNIKPKFQQGMALDAGDYTIDVATSGFETAVRTVQIISGGDTTITVKLERAVAQQEIPAPEQALDVQPAPAFHETADALPALPELHDETDNVAPTADAGVTGDPLSSNYDGSTNIAMFDTEAFLTMARLAMNVGDYVGALESCESALRVDENNVEALQISGEAYMHLHQYEESAEQFRKGLSIAPQNKSMQQGFELVRHMRGKSREEQQSFSKASELKTSIQFVFE